MMRKLASKAIAEARTWVGIQWGPKHLRDPLQSGIVCGDTGETGRKAQIRTWLRSIT